MSEKNQTPGPPSIHDLEIQLLEKNPRIFKGISNTKKGEILHSLKDLISIKIRQEITQSMSYSGPVPHPDIIKEYTEINPDFAQKIIQMAADEQSYAQSRDNKIIEKSFELKRRGQNYALIIALIAIIGGITCILFDHEIAGTALSGVGLTGLVAEFLGKSKKTADNPEKK